MMPADCSAPQDGLSVGHHQVAVSLQDPSNPNAGPRELVQWEFDVTQ